MSQQALNSAKSFIASYRAALDTLKAHIGAPFLQALPLIQSSNGHVVG